MIVNFSSMPSHKNVSIKLKNSFTYKLSLEIPSLSLTRSLISNSKHAFLSKSKKNLFHEHHMSIAFYTISISLVH